MADDTKDVTTTGTGNGLVARLAAERRAFKDALKRVRGELAQLKTTLQTKETELTTAKQAADGNASAEQVRKLTAELRTIKHRNAFDKIAGEAKVKPGAALDDLWNGSGYKPEADQVDEAAIRQAIEAQKTARPYLFDLADGSTATPADGSTTTPPAPKPGPAYGQGGSTTTAAKFTDDQLSDPVFAFKNFERISAAASERVARGEV